MPSNNLNLREADVVRLTLEFLHNRDLHISQLSLERETGVINGNFTNEVLFLRQLILDGQWDDALDSSQPLRACKNFQYDKFQYAILRHKYIELLCMRSEIKAHNNEDINKDLVDEVVKILRNLEKLAPSKEEYSNLCLLLTLPSITQHAQFEKWNPSNARVQCFREVYPLVEKFLPCGKKSGGATQKCAKNDRLIQLLIKGILYESCVNYCQAKASSKEAQDKEVTFSNLLDGSNFDESDLSLLSWLQSIPAETFSVPFEQRMLNVDVEKLDRPSLHTSWTEHMLVTPIKPHTFPHSSMAFKRPRSAADAMTRSLRPLPDGNSSRHQAPMALSAIDYNPSSSSFNASFHLTGIKGSKLMNMSVDRLFDNESKFNMGHKENLIPIGEVADTTQKNESRLSASNATTPEHRGNDSVSSPVLDCSSLAERMGASPQQAEPATTVNVDEELRRELMKDFQLQKQRECEAYLRNLCPSEPTPPKTNDEAGEGPSFLPSPLGNRQKNNDKVLASSSRNRNFPRNNNTLATSSPIIPRNEEADESSFICPIDNLSDFSQIFNDTLNSTQITKRDAMTGETSEPAHMEARNGNTASVPVASASGAVDGGEPAAGRFGSRPTFKPVTVLEDLQALRCAEFHPNGKLYAVGSNTKMLRICAYPKIDIRETAPKPPRVLLKRTKHHKGSIYCLAWSPAGDLLATGSNDKTVKLMRFNSQICNLEGQEVEFTMHDGTVRDVCFIEDTSNNASLLVSGGAGDCKIYVTDCATGNAFQALSGHTGHVLSLYNWGGAMFVSGSQDKSVRFWDLRTGGCVNVINPPPGTGKGSPVASLVVDQSGRLLVSGHDDGSCGLHDVRGARALQRFVPHTSDVRSVRFSPGEYYLLTAGYDGCVVLTDLQGDLTCPLPSVLVARHPDKVISARWHPDEFSFLSTSADKTAVLWTIPPV